MGGFGGFGGFGGYGGMAGAPGGFGGFGPFGGGFGNIALINQLRREVVLAQIQATTTLNTTNTTIQNNIEVGKNTIDTQLQTSLNHVATDPNPNAKACSAPHSSALALVNSDSLDICDQAAQLQAIKGQISILASFHFQVSQVYIRCPIWLGPDRAQCIQDFSTEITTPLSQTVDGVVTAAATVQSDSDQCIQAASQSASAAISTADNAYNNCLNSIA